MGLHPFPFVHAELHSSQRLVVEVSEVERALAAAEEFAHVAREVHRRVVPDARDGHFLDALDGQVHVEPVLSVIDVAVVLDFVDLTIFAARVVHHHNVAVFQVFAYIFGVERLRCEFLHAHNLSLAVAARPLELRRRFSKAEGENAIDVLEHLNLLRFKLFHRGFLRFLSFGSRLRVCLTQSESVLAELEFQKHSHLRGVVAAEGLRHRLGRHNAIFGEQVGHPRELPAVAQRIAEQPVNLTVIVRKRPRVDDALKKEVGFLNLVVEEDIVLRELELRQVIFLNHPRPQHIKPSEQPAPSGRLLVGDSFCLHPVREMSVNHCRIFAVYRQRRNRGPCQRISQRLVCRRVPVTPGNFLQIFFRKPAACHALRSRTHPERHRSQCQKDSFHIFIVFFVFHLSLPSHHPALQNAHKRPKLRKLLPSCGFLKNICESSRNSVTLHRNCEQK